MIFSSTEKRFKHEKIFRIGRNGLSNPRFGTICSTPTHLETTKKPLVWKRDVGNGLARPSYARSSVGRTHRHLGRNGIGEEKGCYWVEKVRSFLFRFRMKDN